MSNKLTRVVALILAVFALIYFGYQIYHFFYTPYQTEVTEVYQYVDEVELEGVLLKNEEVISKEHDGVIQYEYHNAKKVVEGSVVGTIYQSEADVSKNLYAKQLDEKISVLQELQTLTNSSGTDLQSIHSAVEREQSDLVYLISQDQYSELSDRSSEFLKQLLKQEKALAPELNFGEELSSLQTERKALEVPEGETVKAPIAGYFTSALDGYEGVITPESLDELSVDAITDLLENTKAGSAPQNVVGKMVASTDWKFAALVKTKDLEKLKEGQKVSLVFSGGSSNRIEAKVEKINKNLEEETSSVLLSSSIMNEDIIDLRKEKPVIYFGSGKGLRVDREAVRMKDGQTGVYINSGRVVRFRKIDIVYSTDDYVISKMSDEDGFLQLYDEVIIEGKDELYDGKPM